MRTSRILYIIFEAVTILLVFLIMVLLYYHVRSYIRKDFIKNRTFQINRTSELLDAFLERKKKIFEQFCSVSGKAEAVTLLNDFADVYTLDSRLKVKQILLRDHVSMIFPGYDYSPAAVSHFFKGIDSSGIHNSGMFKSGETGGISLYIASKQGNSIIAGRVPLSKLSFDFAIFAGYRDEVILFASGDGEVLASSRDTLTLSFLPDDYQKTVALDREYFITKKFNRSINGMIVLLTPVSAVYNAVDVTRRYMVYFFIFLSALIALRVMLLLVIIIRPLERFIGMLTEWGIENRPEMHHSLFFRIREFDTLYSTFFEKTLQVHDLIRELRENETELESMKQYLKSIIDSMPSIIISVDMNARVTEWNRAAEEFTGIAVEHAEGRPIWHMIPELGKYSDAFYETLSRSEVREFKKQVFAKNEKLYMDITIFPVTGLESVAAAIRIDDITMFEKAEKNLRQAQKMEIVSTLSTGLAHDFNNVLGGILGAASIMKKKITGDSDFADLQNSITRYLEIIETSANRAADIITRLLALSMRQEVEFRVTDLNIIASSVESICKNSLDKSVVIHTIQAHNAPVVNADRNQIEQVMLNLCINAAHSMTVMRPDDQQKGGRLTIKITDRISGGELSPVYVEANPGIDYRSFSVTDEGVGIEPSRLSKIFEPFYSTKSGVSGSGLGLAMAYNIIRVHGGFITVDSEPGSGSSFTVYLPAVNAENSHSADEPLQLTYPGEGIVFVIDDEPVIRELASEILEICGYSVITASDGPEALDVFREKCGSIKLVLLDLTMPGMSGIEILAELQKIAPGVKVLMSSGFVHDERIGKAASSGAAGFIHKPYTMEKLSETVHRILGEKSPG